jgi:hypothetical protein
MSKSVKRNNKYYGEEYESHEVQQHREHLKEKKLRAALTSKNWAILQRITEEEY